MAITTGGMSFQVVNGPEFAMSMKQRAMKIAVAMEAATKKCAYDINKDAKKDTPVRTGNLRKGWEVESIGRAQYEVSNHAENDYGDEYGIYVEHGNGYFSGRYMLTKAVHKNEPIFRIQMAKAIGKACV